MWHKGETSGHFQNIKGMYLDCDLDTLLIFVEQIGVACHTGAYSCFFNEILPFDNTNIFRSLEKLIANRKQNPVEKSYTNYLLDQGVDKICKTFSTNLGLSVGENKILNKISCSRKNARNTELDSTKKEKASATVIENSALNGC